MDQSATLILHFTQDGDGTGKLCATAHADGFAGTGCAWFSCGDVLDFAEALTRIPVPTAPALELAGGFWSDTLRGTLEQEHLALRVYPLNSRGHIGIQVRLATERGPHDPSESQCMVRLVLRTTYAALVPLSMQLKALVEGRIHEVRVEAQDIA